MPPPAGKPTAWVRRIWLDGGCRQRWYMQENRCAGAPSAVRQRCRFGGRDITAHTKGDRRP